MALMIDKQLFSLAEAYDQCLVGGKAYALGEMIRAGFNVPDGFVLSANAFMMMTPSLRSLLFSHFDKLQADVVAVRSSAINEDGVDAAWAGQLETFLNRSRHNLLKSIEDCWESVNSTRAQSYAKQKEMGSMNVAVIVQKMIQSEVSGIAFSAHPISNDRTQLVIEAGFGLGEAIVSGEVTPDTYVVDKKTGRLLEKQVSQQERKLIRATSGATAWDAIGPEGSHQKLTEKQISKLCDLTTELEAFFKYPVDVEWALRGDILYILQSRPITTLRA